MIHDLTDDGGVCRTCSARRGYPAFYAPCPGVLTAHNGGRCRPVRIGDEEYSIAEWARRKGIREQTIHNRIADGWDPVRAVLTPLRKPARAVADAGDTPAAILRRAGYDVDVMPAMGGWVLAVRIAAREETRDAAE